MSRTEIIDTESQESHADEYSWPLATLGRVWHFGVLLPLAVIGGVLTWPRRRVFAPLYALAGAYALSVLAFYVVARYRLPLVPLLIPFAAAGLRGLTSARAASVAVAIVVAIVVTIPANSPVH